MTEIALPRPKSVGLAVVTFGAVWYANEDRGVPKVILILGLLLAFWSFIASKTRFGRHVYSVGGNAEASRRAGIAVDRVRIAVFMISSFMAGVGGIMLALGGRIPISPYVTTLSFLIYVVCRVVGGVRAGRGLNGRVLEPDAGAA